MPLPRRFRALQKHQRYKDRENRRLRDSQKFQIEVILLLGSLIFIIALLCYAEPILREAHLAQLKADRENSTHREEP
ncbi:hypothetical protein CRE_23506 [Caenorhabditis remanei]|uniref:Uncharacterized protein n=1 Tax=Caenorhabditis remanei TaxID=31234 RepID=E3MH34_CAERE|nr:hypothetical protein CRE_23506 [Caenorhabditis remanei]